MNSITIFIIAIIGCCISYCYGNTIKTNDEWTLSVIHTNDMHARLEQTSILSSKCLPKDAEAGNCYGGFARIATLVRRGRNSTVPTIFLNAGDTYQGTIWYTVHKWKIISKFLNILNPDAISLGNHEFDDGPDGLIPFINAATFPIVTANLNLTNEPELSSSNLKNSVILNIDGHKIGVIGYLTPETKIISDTGNVEFLDEIKCIRDEVKQLQNQGINILIALGHSGFIADKKIAAEVDGLDLVIGGHSNTFLYTGNNPNVEIPEGLYPTEIIQKNGRKVYVVQAYAYTKYLGNLTINFDNKGEIKYINGDPILIDSSIEEAKDILDELERWRPALNNLTSTVVGSTKVLLDGDQKHCRAHECNMGNLIVDAMIDHNVRDYTNANRWTDAAIAIHNSGSVRTSIAKSQGEITMSDVLSVLPFSNTIVKMDLSGKIINEMLEHSVYYLNYNDTSDLRGGFLHFSGIQVYYNLSKPSGSRVKSVLMRCADCRVPILEKLDVNKIYKVLTNDFIAHGGDGFSMLSNINSSSTGITTDQAVIDYLSKRSPVYPGVEWRIKFTDSNYDNVINTNTILNNRSNSAKQHNPIVTLIILKIAIIYSILN